MCFDTVYPNRQSYAGQPPGVVSRNPNMQAMRPQQHQAPMPMQRAPVVGTNVPTVPQQGNVLQASVLPQQPRNLACMLLQQTQCMHLLYKRLPRY